MQYGDRVTKEQLAAEWTRAAEGFVENGRVNILRMAAENRGRYNWFMSLRASLMNLSSDFRTTAIFSENYEVE